MNISLLFDQYVVSILSDNLNKTLIILTCVIFFFIRGKPRADLVALCGLLALVLTGVIDAKEALSGFSNSVTLMIIGVFIVGTAIFRTGLAKMIGSRLVRLAGSSENKLFILIMLATAFLGAFISNTGVVAMMLPIVISISASANISPKRFLMPMAFASTLGFFTLISTPPNLVIQNSVTEGGFKPFGFFSFAPVGFICLAIGTVMLFFLSKLLVKRDEADGGKRSDHSLTELIKKYHLGSEAFLISVRDSSSPVIGKTLAELKIGTVYGININRVSKKTGGFFFSKNRHELMAGPDTVLEKNDLIYCQGHAENAERFAKENKLKIVKEHDGAFSEFKDFGIAEVYVLPTSKLIRRTVADIRFRETYHVNILGIHRRDTFIMDNIGRIKLREGDALLVHGSWDRLAILDEDQADLVLVGQPMKEAAKVTLDNKAPLVAIIMALMIVCLVFEIIPSTIAVLAAAALMALTGCLKNMEESYTGINWQSVVLISAMIPMSIAFEKTGITNYISDGLVLTLGESSKYAILGGIYLCTSILTLFISNTATAILFAPIAMQVAVDIGINPHPFLMAVAVSASMAFASPFATPPNAIVMTAGHYSFMDYVKVGLPVQVVVGFVMVLTLPLIFPF